MNITTRKTMIGKEEIFHTKMSRLMDESGIGSDIISSISYSILLSLGIKIWCPMSEFSGQMCTFSAQHTTVLRCES